MHMVVTEFSREVIPLEASYKLEGARMEGPV